MAVAIAVAAPAGVVGVIVARDTGTYGLPSTLISRLLPATDAPAPKSVSHAAWKDASVASCGTARPETENPVCGDMEAMSAPGAASTSADFCVSTVGA